MIFSQTEEGQLLKLKREALCSKSSYGIRVVCSNGELNFSPATLASMSQYLHGLLQERILYDDSIVLVAPDLDVADLVRCADILFWPGADLASVSLSVVESVRRVKDILLLDVEWSLSEPEPQPVETEEEEEEEEETAKTNNLWEPSQTPLRLFSDDDDPKYLSDVDILSLSEDTIDVNFSDQHARLVCLICYKIFPEGQHEAYKIHVQKHSKTALKKVKIRTADFQCPLCFNAFYSDKHLLKHKKEEHQVGLECPTCGRECVNLAGYDSHVRSCQQPKKVHKCQECGKEFLHLKRLQAHSHDGFGCGHCGKRFANRSLLQIHERVHTGEKPFKCEQCDKTFSQKRSLAEHQLTHGDRRTFSCEICDKSFVQKNHLKYHRASVHGIEGKHKCEACGKAFAFGYQLKAHVLRKHEKGKSKDQADQI